MLPGDVEAFYDASIHGQTSGYVREWRKDIGAKVRKGDILAVVDTPELDERIAAAESELLKAKANQALARVTAQRWNSLRNSAAVSQQAADEKESDANAKNAEAEAAQANVDRLKALKAFANIVAPFDGVVTARNVDVGSLVKADSNDFTALFSVADIHQMRVYVRAPELYAAGIERRYEGHARIARIPRPHFRRDNRNDFARDRQEIARAARRAPRGQRGRRPFARRVRAGPFSDSPGPGCDHASGQRVAFPRRRGGGRDHRS